MFVTSGFQKVAQHLVEKYKIPVQLNHKVIDVNYSATNQKTTVTCEKGTKFTADYVVINVPLGVLKKKTLKFTPKLPEEKLKAIERIGFGNLCKVLVSFPRKVPWNREANYIAVVPYKINERGLFTQFVNLDAVAGVPAVLTFGSGNNAD